MPKVKQRTLIFLAGVVWLAVGIFLMAIGIRMVIDPTPVPGFSLLAYFGEGRMARQNGTFFLLTAALLVGYLKGRFVLARSVQRQVKRILALTNPASLRHLYSRGYYFLIACMIGFGICLRFMPISPDTRGCIDVAIGSALINGAVAYFRTAAFRSQAEDALP